MKDDLPTPFGTLSLPFRTLFQLIQLALETSTRTTSICLLDHTRVIGFVQDSGGTASVTLIPLIKQLLEKGSLRPAAIEAVSISIGPGSFTGLRLGVSTVKTLAWALGCRVYPVGTHLVIAQQALGEQKESPEISITQIATVIDAQRGQWFSQCHEIRTDGFVNPSAFSRISDPQNFVDSLRLPTLICGSGLSRFRDRIHWPAHVKVATEENWIPQADTVGKLVAEKTHEVKTVDPFQLVPVYGRKSAAEEKLKRP